MFYVVKCKLRPKKYQSDYFDKNIGCCRFIYNHCLDYCIDHYEKNKDLDKKDQQKRPSSYDLQKLLPALKRENVWLAEVDSQALKYAAAQVDPAFKNFFRRLKTGEAPGFPRYKRKYKSRASFTLTQGEKIDYRDNAVRLPKIGWVRLDHTNFNPPNRSDTRVKRCTISRSPSGNYYISMLFADDLEEPEEHHSPDNKITALDIGLKLSLIHISEPTRPY